MGDKIKCDIKQADGRLGSRRYEPGPPMASKTGGGNGLGTRLSHNCTFCHLFQPQQALCQGGLLVIHMNVVKDRTILSKLWEQNLQ